MRGVAVGLVVLFHLLPGTLPGGFLGVDMFFVISGFVVSQSLETHGWLDFYGRRIKRILPPLYACIAGTLVLSSLLIPPSDLAGIFKTAASALLGAGNLALWYARFDYFNPDFSLNPFMHTWSLGAEEQFYLVLPALLLWKPMRKSPLLLALAAASLAYWIHLEWTAPLTAFYNPLARFWEILCGVLLFFHRDRVRLPKAAAVVAWALIVVALFRLTAFGNLLVVLGAAALIATGSKILESGALVWLGKRSYSIYLWHYPLFALALWNADPNNGFVIAAVLVGTIVLAMLSYRFVELPFRYASTPSLKAIAMGAAAGVLFLVSLYGLYLLPPSKLYLGDAAQYSGLWPPASAPLTPAIRDTQRNCHLEYLDDLPVLRFQECATPRSDKPFVFVLGNSQTQQWIPMLEFVSQELGYGYSALTVSRCRLVSAAQMINIIDYRYDLCKDYFDRSVEFILSTARSGDLVLIGPRSLVDPPDPSSADNPSDILANGTALSFKDAHAQSIADVSRLAKALADRGTTMVLVGPLPQFRKPATQCVPEWFRMTRADCAIPVEWVQAERASYLKSVAELTTANSNVYFWDPIPSLCEERTCTPSRNGRLWFRDDSHLSFVGAQSLAPSFMEFLKVTPIR